MKRILVTFVALALATAAFAGPQAILSGLKGKVEIRPQGGAWAPASEGMKIDLRTTISTGFDSTAVIEIEKSRIVVKPLTRLSLDKLLEQSAGSVSASLFLRVGSVKASVKASTPGVAQDFKVQSPYSTASVRGTQFEFDGFRLQVFEGVVRMVPGRPTRDIEGDDGGFQGARDVDAARGGEGLNVGANQEAVLTLDDGTGGARRGDRGGAGGPGGGQAQNHGQGGGVTIKIVVKD